MTLIIKFTNGKRIQRKRSGRIFVRNTKKSSGKIVAEFFDINPWEGLIDPPFAECPVDIIKYIKNVKPVISTFAK